MVLERVRTSGWAIVKSAGDRERILCRTSGWNLKERGEGRKEGRKEGGDLEERKRKGEIRSIGKNKGSKPCLVGLSWHRVWDVPQ